MTDITKENVKIPNPIAANAADDAARAAPKEKHRTVGNRIYDWLIYASVAWGGVAGLSLLSAHEAMHGSNKMFGWLRWIDKNATAGFEKIFSKIAKKENVRGWAHGTTMFLTLGMGGNALIGILKWLEDNREHNAARIDRALGTTPPDPETIAAEVPQTWKSVFTGRLASWGLSYLAFVAMGPQIAGAASNWCGEKFTKGWVWLRPASNQETVRKWADIGAFDALFTIITASMTYCFSRLVAKRDQTKAVQKETPELPPLETAAEAPTHKPLKANSLTAHKQFTDYAIHKDASKGLAI